MGTQRGIATWSPAGIYMQYARYSKNSFRFAASTLWNSLPDHFRTEIVSLNSRVFCSPGMGPNVAVLHVDDSNFASGLLNFNF
jgi:hypothetical protein